MANASVDPRLKPVATQQPSAAGRAEPTPTADRAGNALDAKAPHSDGFIDRVTAQANQALDALGITNHAKPAEAPPPQDWGGSKDADDAHLSEGGGAAGPTAGGPPGRPP